MSEPCYCRPFCRAYRAGYYFEAQPQRLVRFWTHTYRRKLLPPAVENARCVWSRQKSRELAYGAAKADKATNDIRVLSRP